MGSISCLFTKFNRRTVNGPFSFFFLFSFFILSGAGINQEVSGGHWIWVVVLFTDDWLASQNHQIHLPTVTFITVIFKATETCPVSLRWPPRVRSHRLPFPPFLFSSYFVTLLLLVVSSPCLPSHLLPSPPSFNYFCLTFYLPACPPSLCWAGWREQGQGGVKTSREKRGEEEKIRPQCLLFSPFFPPLSEGCVQNPHIVRSPVTARNSFALSLLLSLTGESLFFFFFPSQQMNANENFGLQAHWSHLHMHLQMYSLEMVSLML